MARRRPARDPVAAGTPLRDPRPIRPMTRDGIVERRRAGSRFWRLSTQFDTYLIDRVGGHPVAQRLPDRLSKHPSCHGWHRCPAPMVIFRVRRAAAHRGIDHQRSSERHA